MVDAGALLAERYELTEMLGRGGMGVVYLANDRKLQRPVAVKVLHTPASRENLERFRREARIAAALDHPGICRVLDFHDEDELPFIVMEPLDGITLSQAITQRGPLNTEEAARLGVAVAEALHAAHTAGAVHRDVKPANICLLRGGGVKVTDFGIALAQGPTVTATGEVLGTPHYLAPEQVEGARATPRSDVYALGCVLYEALTGEPPFDAEGALAIGMAHLYAPPPSARKVRPEVPEEIDLILQTALAKNPDDRFQSAQEMAESLRHFLSAAAVPPTVRTKARPRDTQVMPTATIEESESLSAPAETAPTPRLRRRPILAVLGLASIITLLLLLALVIRNSQQQAPAEDPQPERLAVPDWSGQPLEVARVEAEALGLEVGDVSEALSPEAPGTVITQNPGPDAEMAPGTTISFVISDGEGVEVPDVIGLSLDQAEEVLESHGLEAEADTRGRGRGRRRVVDQDPAAGTLVRRETAVRLSISERIEEDD